MSDQDTPAPGEADPGRIMGILAGYWQARILLTAAETDLFTVLAEGPAAAGPLSERLGLRMPGTRDLLFALEGMGLLESTGDGLFRNSAEAERFLAADSPTSIGGYLRFCENELNPAWDGLGAALRTGLPQNPAARSGNPYDSLYADQGATESFLKSMDMLNTPLLERLDALDWTRYRSFADIGGARGNVALHLVGNHPHLSGTVFDLPPLAGPFEAHAAPHRRSGQGGPLDFVGGDFFKDPLPEADVLILGHVLHNWGTEDRRTLLKSAYTAVRPGGAVLVYDPMVGGGSKPPLYAALAALAMLVWSSGGGEYSVGECHEWLAEAGFRPETVGGADTPDDVLVIGHKDR